MRNTTEALTIADIENAMKTLSKAREFMQMQAKPAKPAKLPKWEFLRPSKGKAKPVKTPKAVKPNQPHANMKALVKAGGKTLAQAFSKRWMELRQEAGFGTKGNIPKDAYFALQAQAYADVA
jgi:cell envelope opacity-associated protein A